MKMQSAKKRKLEASGWRVGQTEDFLGLSSEERVLVDMRVALTNALKEKRKQKHLTQEMLAELIHSSQSRVAKMEAGDVGVTLDLIIKSLVALGTSQQELARVISGQNK